MFAPHASDEDANQTLLHKIFAQIRKLDYDLNDVNNLDIRPDFQYGWKDFLLQIAAIIILYVAYFRVWRRRQ